VNAGVAAVSPGVHSRPALQVEAGIAPLQFARSQLHRKWDATLWGTYEYDKRDTWGAAFGIGPIINRGSENSKYARRITPQVIGRITTEGRAVGARVTLEAASFFDGEFANSGDKGFFMGAGYGEWGLGLYLETLYQERNMRANGLSATAGLSVRLPALIGIACCMH
jgi:hypothetical protein